MKNMHRTSRNSFLDINIEFVVGNNDLDFYRFLNENGGLPDIITCCRFSLHDASPLKDSLMDLSTTNAAGAVYDTYLNNFMNEDGEALTGFRYVRTRMDL